jgi:hypothetical protein
LSQISTNVIGVVSPSDSDDDVWGGVIRVLFELDGDDPPPPPPTYMFPGSVHPSTLKYPKYVLFSNNGRA